MNFLTNLLIALLFWSVRLFYSISVLMCSLTFVDVLFFNMISVHDDVIIFIIGIIFAIVAYGMLRWRHFLEDEKNSKSDHTDT